MGFSFTCMEKKMRNDSGTSEGRKREIEIKIIEIIEREKGVALCNQLSLRLFFP